MRGHLSKCPYMTGVPSSQLPVARGHLSKCPYMTGVPSSQLPVARGHLSKCPYMTGVPSSQVHFNVKVHCRHPDRCPLITGFTVL